MLNDPRGAFKTRSFGEDRNRYQNRRYFLGCLGSTLPVVAWAQKLPSTGLKRIGFLNGDLPALTQAFNGELRRLGYIEGKNLTIETRLTQPNSNDGEKYAAELAQMDLQLVVAGALPFALEIRKANPAMPMVIATCPGMVSNGFAASLERPGGHVTGVDELPPGVTAKRLTLLKAAAPNVSRIALLSTTPGRGGHETQVADAERVAAGLGVTVKAYRAASSPELERALIAIAKDSMNGLVNFQGGLSVANRGRIVEFAAKQALPAIYQATMFAESGGLLAWAPNLEEQYAMAARYVDKILKGANPGELSIQYPSRYYLTINSGAAKGLGLTLPAALLAQADRVIP